MNIKKQFQLWTAALICTLICFVATSAQTKKQLPVSSQTLTARFVGMERVLPNGNVVVVDTLYDENGLNDIGVVYLYDSTRSFVISTLKGTSANDRIGSGGVTVLPDGNFIVSSPNWKDPAGSIVGATATCDAATGCTGGINIQPVAAAERTGAGKRAAVKIAPATSAFVATEQPVAAEPQIIAAPGDIVFDSITNVTAYNIPSATRTFIGEAFNVQTGTTNQAVAFGKFDTLLASAAAVNYTNVRLNVVFWGVANTAATPVFSTPLGSYAYDLGPLSAAANTVYNLNQVVLPTPIPIAVNTTNLGITFNYQGDTGTGLANTDNLTTTVRFTTAVAVGSTTFNGYFRNASGRTDFNFASTDARNIGANSAIALRLYSAVPTAAGVALGGRITTQDGRSVSRAKLVLTAANGAQRFAATNSSGYYRFANVAAGQTYTLYVRHKRFVFAPQVVNVTGENDALNFTAQQ